MFNTNSKKSIVSHDDPAVIKNFIYCGLIVLFTFSVIYYSLIYYGTEWYITNNTRIYLLYFMWELNIPYIPLFYSIYYSVLIIPFLTPLIIKNKYTLYKLTLKLTFAILISGILFYLYPSKLGYLDNLDINNIIENTTRKLIGRDNPFPSLHILLVQIFLFNYMSIVNKKYKSYIIVYFFLVILSTLFTHQHHLLDIICSLAIGYCLESYYK